MDTRQQLSELQRTFVAPPRFGESRPRQVQLTPAGRALCALAVILFAGALAAMVGLTQVARRQAADRASLADRGVTTPGVVTRLWQDGDNRRRVAYRFEIGGRSYASDVKVSAERRRVLEVGSPVDVRVLPGRPDVNDLGTPRSGLPMAIGPLVGAAMAALGGLCLLSIRVQWRLLQDGRAAPAIVTAHTSRRSSHGTKHHAVTYEFLLLSGARATGTCDRLRTPSAIGSVITVVYDPERPGRSRVFPFSLVRPA